MAQTETSPPGLDFTAWRISFPERGHCLFLPADDLRSPQPSDGDGTRSGLWLLRAETGLSVVIPSGVTVVRGGSAVTGLAVLHDGDVLEVAGHAAVYQEINRLTIAAGSRLAGRRCPRCLTRFEAGDEVFCCPLCDEGYCPDCWEDLVGQRCCSRNCRFTPASREATVSARRDR